MAGKRAERRALIALFVAVALTLNVWAVERLVSPDEHISSAGLRALIVFAQACFALTAVWLAREKPQVPPWLGKSLAALMWLLIAVGSYGSLRALHVIDPHRELREAWRDMDASEELIRSLSPRLGLLDSDLRSLELPGNQAGPLFAPRVEYRPVIPSTDKPAKEGVIRRQWSTGPVDRAPLQQLRIWHAPLLDLSSLLHGRFVLSQGRFIDGRKRFATTLLFEGLFTRKGGGVRAIRATVDVRFRRSEGPAPRDAATTRDLLIDAEEAKRWRIDRWATRSFETFDAPTMMFEEVLDRALGPGVLERARRSLHEEHVQDWLVQRDAFEKPHEHFSMISIDRHPGIAVTDIDRDGRDDLFVVARWGQHLLLRNLGDGTFEDVAATYGLANHPHTASAVFADFDNDGDTDVVLGRTLAPSLLLLNDGGRFARSPLKLPGYVSSVTAVDYDGDGLLDVYLSTYLSTMAPEHLEAGDRAEFLRRARLDHPIRDDVGPPNVLLHNDGGGRFSVVRETALRIFRNTYQSTWADYDGDGDADVYLANDYAPNNFMRNDGGRFVDVTDETHTADIGFGMGASFGDYDGDGRQDLYVSNMYSKAGQRISRRLAVIDPRLSRMARGNSLFRNTGSAFEKVSGTSEPALRVENAGWAWGGQFIDVDNDGFLDIHSLNGHYTAPRKQALPVDL
ncbi:VCBS repeat-containing protein [Endomicrobium sp. AH-315-J14]|nr:VCBS repeat-containing protein [Endomicrobium sp. AH-315-J14]